MQKKIPQRQCMGCRERKAKRELIRVVRSPEGEVSLDFGGKKNGRGAYICPNPECLKKAIRSKALDRSLEVTIPEGEEPVGAIARAGKAYLILVAADASDNTWRRAKSFAAGTDQQCVRLKSTKEEMGFAIGRTSLAIAAVTDVRLALTLLTALGEPEKNREALEVLSAKAEKVKKHQAEAKAHVKNVRKGKKKQ